MLFKEEICNTNENFYNIKKGLFERYTKQMKICTTQIEDTCIEQMKKIK